MDTETVTRLLDEHGRGDATALDRLLPLLYADLRRLARHQMRGRPERTLQPTAVVHEAWFKLVRSPPREWGDRGHFLAVAARAMRQVLVDDAAAKAARKRGSGRRPEPLEEANAASTAATSEEVLAVHAALERLEEIDERLARVVECRWFVGLTEGETAEALGTSESTVRRDWTRARLWLRRELAPRD